MWKVQNLTCVERHRLMFLRAGQGESLRVASDDLVPKEKTIWVTGV
jgi:hypothetical protein